MDFKKDTSWKSLAERAIKAGPYNMQNDEHQTEERKAEAQKFYEENSFRYEEIWSLDHSFTCWIVPRLAFLRDNHTGYPSSLITESDKYGNPLNDDGDKRWITVLNKMIEGFLLYAEKDCGPLNKEEQEKVNQALELFKEFFYALWD